MATLWTRDRETVWAFNVARRWRRKLKYGESWEANGRTVIVARAKKPYGHSSHHRTGNVSHVPRVTLIAWKGGRFMGSQVRWLCGAITENFVLEDTPSFKPCPMCQFRLAAQPALF